MQRRLCNTKRQHRNSDQVIQLTVTHGLAQIVINLARRIYLGRTRGFHLLHERLEAAETEAVGLADVRLSVANVLPEAQADVKKVYMLNHTKPAIAPVGQGSNLDVWGDPASHVGRGQYTLESQLELETQSLERLKRSDDARGAYQNFMQKRNPEYQGR